jgi:hypothetical protein
LILLGCASWAQAGALGLRFCENRADGVVLEIPRETSAGAAVEPNVLIATPPDAHCSLSSSAARLVSITNEAVLRDRKIVSLTLARDAEVSAPVQFVLAFDRAYGSRGGPSRASSPWFEPVFRSLAANEPIPDGWRSDAALRASAPRVARPFPPAGPKVLKIRVSGAGRVAIAWDALARAFSLPADSRSPEELRRRLRLWHDGKPHPLQIESGVSASAATSGTRGLLSFEASPFSSRYTRWDAYWLTWDGYPFVVPPLGGTDPENKTPPEGGTTNLAGYPFVVPPLGGTDPENKTPRGKTPPEGGTTNLETVVRETAGIDDLLSTSGAGADLIYICHPEFLSEIQPLAQWRRQCGLRVAVVSSEAVADAFNFGRDEPEAIRRFLAWACANWPAPAPAYVALVGDASAEPKSTDSKAARNFISTIYGEVEKPPAGQGPGAPADPSGNLPADRDDDPPANDDAYVTLLAGSPLPQLMLGRISVNAPGQLAAIVEKLIAHERAPQPGPWRGRLLLIVDAGYERLFEPSITRRIPAHFDVERIDVRDYPCEDHYNLENTKISRPCREDVVRRLSEGAAAVHYAGHGGISLISHVKALFWTDVARLENAGRLPLFVQVSCRTGGFDWPEQEWNACLSEHLLRQPGAGALGVIAASRALFGDEVYLQELLFRAYRGRRSMALGEVRLLMKTPYLLNRRDRDFIDSYNLLGDPASRIVFPQPLERLVIDPPEAVAGSGREIRVKGYLPERSRPPDGWAALWWRDEAGRRVAAAERVEVRGGQFAATLRLSDEATSGRRLLVAFASISGATSAPIAGEAPDEYQGVAELRVLAPAREYPNDPEGQPDLAFAADRFEFVDPAPTDGETIRVRAVVENRGTVRSEPSKLSWTWRRTGEPQPPLPVAEAVVPALYPTERATLTLRWDPTHVAGLVENHLQIAPPRDEEQQSNNTVTRTIQIRTKPDLTLAAAPQWRRNGRELRVTLEVANAGETEARDVIAAVSAGNSSGPQLALGDPVAVAKRLDGGAGPARIEASFILPAAQPPLDYVYIELATAEPVSEIDKRNNRYRFALNRNLQAN